MDDLEGREILKEGRFERKDHFEHLEGRKILKKVLRQI